MTRSIAPVRSFLALGNRLGARPEILDSPVEDAALLAASLHDLARVNRWLAGARLSRTALERLLRNRRPGARPSIRLLDVGTGLADVPVALLAWARSKHVPLEVEAIDSHAAVIEAARSTHGAVPGLTLRLADARALPYADESFDVAHSSLFAHHLEPQELRLSLRELARVSRVGVIVNDLNRNVFALLGALLVTRLFTRNAITRHDGPLSVRRAYTMHELLAVARAAGLVPVEHVWGFAHYRYAVAFRLSSAPDPLRPATANDTV